MILPAREDKWSEQSPGRRAICAELWKVSMIQSRGRLTLSCANVFLKTGMVSRQAGSGRWGIDIPTAWPCELEGMSSVAPKGALHEVTSQMENTGRGENTSRTI